jgi:inosose dehydratase
VWTELGPYGYLPTDTEQLRDELGRRGVFLSGGAVFAGLHRGASALEQAVQECRAEAQLLTALGAGYLVLLPEQYTDQKGGNVLEASRLEPNQWRNLITGMSELGRVLAEEFGVSLVFHPHADSHVGTQEQIEQFLEDTDPATVSLCLDTGHVSYYEGDNVAIIRNNPDRIGYAHLKQVDPDVRQRVQDEALSFAEAVRLGAMVEPPKGDPSMPPLLEALADLNTDLFAIVEQDLYPCDPDVPLPIATRTREYFDGLGLGLGGPGP